MFRRRLRHTIESPLLSELWKILSVMAGVIVLLSLSACLEKGYKIVAKDSNTLQSLLQYIHSRIPPGLTMPLLAVKDAVFSVPPCHDSGRGAT